jgi:uncharacterized membrane protein YhiD involved in acid resistance
MSNRKQFSRNFVLLALTTTLIISIVKSSLALSLGLVGALSIVRFRAAIKEPEELAYLFLAISIGLGLGADQPVPTLVAFLVIAMIIITTKLVTKGRQQPNMYLTVSSPTKTGLQPTKVLELIQSLGGTASVNRLEDSPQQTQASFLVCFKNAAQLEILGNQLRQMDPEINITWVEDRGLGL